LPAKYRFAGERIIIDDAGHVTDIVDDPSKWDFRKIPCAERLAVEFDYVYSKLLNGLQRAFSDTPERMSDAIGVISYTRLRGEEFWYAFDRRRLR
jgi:hypothetical protein